MHSLGSCPDFETPQSPMLSENDFGLGFLNHITSPSSLIRPYL